MATDYPFETDAVIKRRSDPETLDGFWVAEYEHKGTPSSARVSAVDAWNSDVANDLPVRIRVTGPSACRIITRLKNNKKFVKVRKV